jgi:arginyl-tRNA--protein-N-Asp/Glu arginylyltransferase
VKILFSEAKPDYPHYLFPYAIWAVPEENDRPSDLFDAGFLPASRDLDRFYLCRHVRLNLDRFQLSSENRRILRKGHGLQVALVPRAHYHYSPERRQAFKRYADIKFGKDVMTVQRLDNLFSGRIVSHLLVFTDPARQSEIGVATLFLEPPRTAFYYYAFYDLDYYERNLGMFMMTSAVVHFARANFHHLYLGSVYSRNALYKTQFAGAEFFNGVHWSNNLRQLKHLLQRDAQSPQKHLLESEDFLEKFYPQGLPSISHLSRLQLHLLPS